MIDAVELTRLLIQFDTSNPPGEEELCIEFLAATLRSFGLTSNIQRFGSKRANLVCTVSGSDENLAPIVLTGHVDTVPTGATAWDVPPLSGDTVDGKLYGRGSSDMKSGVAAMTAAVIGICANRRGQLKRGIRLVLTSGEETGCQGALQLKNAKENYLGSASALIVAEPTANRLGTGHKGALFLRGKSRGVTVHSSMPEKGVNAIYKVAKAISTIEHTKFEVVTHPAMGRPTINVGTVSGGMNINSVPDAAEFSIDVRTTPSMNHAAVLQQLQSQLGTDISLEQLVDMPSVWTDPAQSFMKVVSEAKSQVIGPSPEDKIFCLPFFSDASVFTPHYRCPTVILGPGEPLLAHQTNEFCYVEKIEQAVSIYTNVLTSWCM